ncbi:MAG TPA: carboxypeptidase regulatory-like domain-containing protein, partial [Candidatus Dormibacteraeota bacterium]|nr:carboxypeptidase regulatory-like domain-containing protein [Candidatus Dormibacteraeota bacterium]
MFFRRSLAIGAAAIALLTAGAASGIASAQSGSSQNVGSIHGRVRDAGGAPIAGAAVNVSGPVRSSTVTDASGDFNLPNLPAAFYSVSINKAGYLPARSNNVAVVAGEALSLHVRLQALSASSLRVIARVIASAKSSINSGAAQTTFLPRSEMTDLANPQINDTVARIPGAGIERGSSSPNTSISLGGAQPYETEVLLDGHPLSGGRYGVWFSQFFSSYMLQGIQTESGPGNTTPFAASAVGGTANLLTPSFTAKDTFEFIDGVDNFGSQYYNLLMTGKDGRLSYVLDDGYQGLNGPFFNQTGCVIKPQSYANLNTSSAAGIIQFCGDLGGPLTSKGQIVKFNYDLSKSTSLQVGFVGSQAGYNPQGSSYGQYGGMVTVLPCMTVGASQQCSNPNYPNLIGTQIPGYIFYPGSVVTNNQPIFDAQLLTTLGQNSILVRPYAGSISRIIDGSGEVNYADHYTTTGSAVTQSAFNLLESDKLRGTTFSFVHPFGENVVTATYDYHSDETFAYYGSPSAVNTPDTISRFNTFSLSGDLAMAKNLTLRAGLYETNWQLEGQQAGPIVGGKPTLVPSSRSL